MQRRAPDNFEAIRVLASIMVVYGHAYPLTASPALTVFGTSIQGMAVNVFFIISGYLVTKSWLTDPSAFRYFMRRALRIMPGLICVVLICILLLGPLVTTLSMLAYFAHPATWHYLTNAILEPNYYLPGVFSSIPYPNAVNGSLWSLPVEVTMYVVMPVLCISRRWFRVPLLVSTIGLCVASLYFLRMLPVVPRVVFFGTDWAGALDVAPFFLLGAVAQVFIKPKYLNVQVALALALLSCAIPSTPVLGQAVLYLLLPYVVLSFAIARPAALGNFGYFGDISYGVYIYGFPCEQLVSQVLKTDQQPLLNFACALPLTVLFALLSWHFLEKKFLLLKPSQRVAAKPAQGLTLASG